MGMGVAALVAAAVLLALTFAGVIGEEYNGPADATEFEVPTRRLIVQVPGATPTTPPPTPSTAAIQTLSIPRFDITAPVVVLGVDDQSVMESPDGPTTVAWYDFSAKPGFPVDMHGGNAVFAGHVDYYNYGPAVFWHLGDLEPNDLVEVTLADGTVYKYSVVSRKQYNASAAPITDIVGDTDTEVITLITCGGTFDSSVGEYNDRVVVRAERLFDGAPGDVETAQTG
jgi:LPXTG-site transpeptidase (sortase) family protein